GAGQSALQCLSVCQCGFFQSLAPVPANIPDQVQGNLEDLPDQDPADCPRFSTPRPASSEPCPPSNKPHWHLHQKKHSRRIIFVDSAPNLPLQALNNPPSWTPLHFPVTTPVLVRDP
ncbi:hypothetical protein ATANTOWER_021767, partial [Ataeniobius toweri]|nr:hypothetical protein [Ataeniobius toweri]